MKVVATDSGHANTDLMPQSFLNECRQLLLDKKEEFLNLSQEMRKQHLERDRSGDEVDQSLDVLAETQLFAGNRAHTAPFTGNRKCTCTHTKRYFWNLLKETEQPIEHARLRAIPWTRLSIEGAELREALHKRFAR